ncbi:MAG: hypothetical protein AABW79_04610 [Nanoarchaeota archaeon]
MIKRGQVVIFVIIALLLIGALLLFFTLRNSPSVAIGEEFSAQAFLGQCLRPEIVKNVDSLLAKGGFAEPNDTIIYDDKKIIYLCKNINYYEKCIMQHPTYIDEVRNELERELGDEITNCFTLLNDELNRRGFNVSEKELEYSAVLKQGSAEISIDKELVLSKGETSESFDNFIIIAKSPIYELLDAAQEIARQEGQFCYFENLGYSLIYRDISIDKDIMSEATKIYTLTHKESGKKLMIAIRGCAIPAGL